MTTGNDDEITRAPAHQGLPANARTGAAGLPAPAIVGDSAESSLPDAEEGGRAGNLPAAALTDQAAYDKLLATNFAAAPMALTSRRIDWNGLTPEQERQRESELWRRRQEQEIAEAEYERTMAEVRERADLVMAQLDKREREVRQNLAAADARAIVLPDGRRVLVGENGEFIAEDTGRTLDGADKADAERRRKPDSETAAERKQLQDQIAQFEVAREHLRKAQELTGQDGKSLTPEQKKEREAEALGEISKAEAVENAASAMSDADTASVFGLAVTAPVNGRTTSFAATMDEKDGRATDLHDHFRGAVQAPASAPSASTTPAVNRPSAGTTAARPPTQT